MSRRPTVQLRRLATCLDGRRVPLNAEQRSAIPGTIPYWGANGVVEHVNAAIFDEELVLLGEDGAPFGDPLKDVAFLIDGPAWINNHIHVLRPGPGTEPRFLTYALNAVDWPMFISGSTRDKLTQEDMWRAQVPRWEWAEQRAIADFLDDETARIDALIAKKRRMLELLSERQWVAFEHALQQADTTRLPLRRALLSISDGPFGSAFSSSDYVDSGVAVIRLGNIGFAEWRGDELVYLPMSRFSEFENFAVVRGDLLIAALGDASNHAGRACVAPDLGRAIVKGKCLRARVDPDVASADFLALLCSAPLGAAAMAAVARGSTRLMINLDIVKSVVLPIPQLEDQLRIVDGVQALWASLERSTAAMTRQIDLLAERRQALITAAVTGELDVGGSIAKEAS